MQPAPFPMSTQDLETLVRRLPAQQQARVRWMKPHLKRAYERLLNEQPNQELLYEVSAEFLRRMADLQFAFIKLLEQVDGKAVLAEMTAKSEEQRKRLQSFLVAPEHVRVADEVVNTLSGLTRLTIRLVQLAPTRPDIAEVVSVSTSELAAMTPEARATHDYSADLRAWLLLGAVLEAAEQDDHQERAMELLGWAHRELSPLFGLVERALASIELEPEPVRVPLLRKLVLVPELEDEGSRIVLSAADFERVEEMLEADSQPTPRLMAALARRKQRMSHGVQS